MEEITIPKGTIVHLKGLPFALAQDTVVLGRAENLVTHDDLTIGKTQEKGDGSIHTE